MADRHRHDYASGIERHRAAKDSYFRTSPASPIPTSRRPTFSGLQYFPVDPALRFEGLQLQPYRGEAPSAFEIPTSDGQLRPAHRVGSFTFRAGGARCSLTAYVIDGGGSATIFVPFLDGTSGVESYGAGRYLDLEPEDDGTYVLDLNVAYHPY